MKKIIEKIKKSVLIKRTTTALFVVGLIALFIILTLVITNLDIKPIDLTSNKIYTLTDKSKELVKDITSKINIYAIGYSDTDSIIDMAKQYSDANENISVETINSTERPDIMKQYKLDDYFSGVVMDNKDDGKYKILSSSEFYTYDQDTYEEIDISEEKLTNAIIYVTSDSIPTAYVLTGYSDFTLDVGLAQFNYAVSDRVMDCKSLNIISTGEIPEDCDTLIIPSPNKDFDEKTTEEIEKYINNGGNVLWYNLLVIEHKDLPNVNKILALYGIEPFEYGVIYETDEARMMKDAPYIIFPEINKYTSVTSNVKEVLMVNPTKINTVSDEQLEELKVTKTAILTTSENAFFRTNLESASLTKLDGEEEGSFLVGAEFDKTVKEATEEEEGVTSKLIIYGDNVFVSDYSLSQTSQYPVIIYVNNQDLAVDTLTYLAERSSSDEDIITIRKDSNKSPYTATEQQNTIIQAIIFTIPVVIIIAGIIVWQYRRRKK